MGRLFWKFFLFTGLAQLAGIIAIVIVFWLTEPAHINGAVDGIDSGPSARGEVGAAAAILRYGGKAAFESWVMREGPQVVYAIDANDRDLLGRSVAPAAIAQAREFYRAHSGSPLIAEVSGLEEGPYLLFAVRGDLPLPEGPMGGDFAGPSAGGPPLRGAPGSPPHHWPPNGPLIGTLLASLLTAALLAWYVAKPIRSLRLAFEAASSGHLDYRVAPVIGARQDELADLGREFDRMVERLADSMGRQKRLLHDVSHEVRSPLARLQAAIGLMRLKGSTDEATFERIEEEIARIDRLVGDLLKLSRIEAGEIAEDLEEVDLRELVSHVVCDANFEAQTVGRQVTWTKQASATVMGRPEMLHLAFENIVRNAIKHAPSSPVVTIETSVDAANSRYIFLVLDTGPGVPEDEVAALFTPFFRSTHALSTDGYGLGLAIASRSIEAHGGTIRAQNLATGGLCVEVTLPLARLQTSDSSGAPYRVGG